MSSQPKLLLVAYACQPNRGSEPGVGWNRALQAARTCRTWVLCEGREFEKPVRDYLAQHGPLANVEFVFLPRSKWNARLHQLPGMYYVCYRLWHRAALQVAKKLHAEVKFDLVHQVSLCGYREPGYMWQLPVPFIWGPLGGAQNYPWRFLPAAGLGGAIKETIRNVLNWLQLKFSRRVKIAARHCAKVLAANTTNAAALASRGIVAEVLLETGVQTVASSPRNFEQGGPLRILWSGVLEHRKALHLLLHALAQLPQDVRYELRILGKGPQEKRLQKLARRLKVDSHCRWLGWVPQPQVLTELETADVFVFSSLRDTTGTVQLESLAHGTPVIALDHQGSADLITPSCGIKLPVESPRQVVADLATALTQLNSQRDRLAELSRGAYARAAEVTWDRLGEQMDDVYRAVLSSVGSPATKLNISLNVPVAGGPEDCLPHTAEDFPDLECEHAAVATANALVS